MKNLIKFITLTMIIALFSNTLAVAADVLPTFTSQSLKISNMESVNYWLFTPKNATANMPLIVYLHGGSGKSEDDDINILTENGFCQWVSQGEFDNLPAYIIFPQLPSKYQGWNPAKGVIKQLVEAVSSKYSINANKISLTGHSMGGTGTYAIGSAYPQLFSCIAPMSGSIECTDTNITALSSMPVWAFVGSDDKIVEPQSSIDFVVALNNNGGDAKITNFEGASHFDIPTLAYLDDSLDVVGWLIGNSKSHTSFTSQSLKISDTENLNYWLFTPKNATANMPLIVYLHGGSGRGDDIDMLIANGFCQWVSQGQFDDVPAYIIFPQLASKYKAGWSQVQVQIKQLIEFTTSKYSIDTNRISLTGHSMGGTGTYAIGSAYPELFSCIAPMSGSIGCTDANITALSSMPVWAFVGSADTTVDPQSSLDFVAALNNNGGDAKITNFDGATHFDIPSLTYPEDNLDVVGWLIGNSKKNTISDCNNNVAVVNCQLPDTYTIIFADFADNGSLSNLKYITQSFEYGKNNISIPDNISIDVNDKIMLWKSMATLLPACEAYIVSE